MNVIVNFSEQSKEYTVKVEENATPFRAELGETIVVGGGEGTGENGATFIPDVSEEGVISWTNDKGLPNPDPVNIKGADGKNGEQGTTGIGFYLGDVQINPDELYEVGQCNVPSDRILQVGDLIYDPKYDLVFRVKNVESVSVIIVESTGIKLKGTPGKDGTDGKDGAQWYFTQAYEGTLQYGNDGDLSVDLASTNLPVYKVDKANNQMVFTGAYLKGEKGDPYTLTQDDKNMLVNDVIAALPKYTGEVESV